MKIKYLGQKMILEGTMIGPRVMAVLLILIILISAFFYKNYDPLIGLIMAVPLLFLENTGKCIIDKKLNKISFFVRKTLQTKQTKQICDFKDIENIGIIGSPDGYGIGFKIDGEWKNATNDFSLSEKRATNTLHELKTWMKSV